MASRSRRLAPLKFAALEARLRRFGIYRVPGRGRGSHVIFSRFNPQGAPEGPSFPIPRHAKRDVPVLYIRAILRRFGISEEGFLED